MTGSAAGQYIFLTRVAESSDFVNYIRPFCSIGSQTRQQEGRVCTIANVLSIKHKIVKILVVLTLSFCYMKLLTILSLEAVMSLWLHWMLQRLLF